MWRASSENSVLFFRVSNEPCGNVLWQTASLLACLTELGLIGRKPAGEMEQSGIELSTAQKEMLSMGQKEMLSTAPKSEDQAIKPVRIIIFLSGIKNNSSKILWKEL